MGNCHKLDRMRMDRMNGLDRTEIIHIYNYRRERTEQSRQDDSNRKYSFKLIV